MLVAELLRTGTLLLTDPETLQNPFYRLAPNWAVYPLVILASAATVIASQAVISGAFSLTNQAVQLGYLPRMQVRHTSAQERGQAFVPEVNTILFLAVVATVVGFRSSNHSARLMALPLPARWRSIQF